MEKCIEDKLMSVVTFRKNSVFSGWRAEPTMYRFISSLPLYPNLCLHPCGPPCPYLYCLVLSSFSSIHSVQIVIFCFPKNKRRKHFERQTLRQSPGCIWKALTLGRMMETVQKGLKGSNGCFLALAPTLQSLQHTT